MNSEHLGSCGVIYQLRKDGFMLKKYTRNGSSHGWGDGIREGYNSPDWDLYMDIGVWDNEFTGSDFTGAIGDDNPYLSNAEMTGP